MIHNRALVTTWKRHFRIEKTTFDFICDVVRADMEKQQTRFRRTLSVEERVGCALWRLATGDSYRSCGLQFGIGKSTAQVITKAFVKAIRKRKDDFIKFPVEIDDVRVKIRDFQCLSKFPNVVGAIDGSHIEICAPTTNAADYFNRNRYYSLVLQGISDANQKFIHIATGFPGSIHDSRILRMCQIYDLAESGDILKNPIKDLGNIRVRPFLIGDPAYALTDWLMKPYPSQNISRSEQKFNRNLSRARVVIEQAFGKLKGRWRCLHKILEDDVKGCVHVIEACCILHNICQDLGDMLDPNDYK